MRNNFFSQQLLPGLYASKVNNALNIEYNKINELIVIIEDSGKELDKSLEQIKNDLENQSERKKSLEDKVKAILFSISIAATAITFSLSSENRFIDLLNICAIILLLISIGYLVFSTISSVQALSPMPFHISQTEIKLGGNTISILKQEKSNQLKDLVKSKLLNDNTNLRIANLTYASLTLFRNGIIFFCVYFIVALIQKNRSSINTGIVAPNKPYIKLNDSTKLILPYTFELHVGMQNIRIEKDTIVILRK